MSFSEATRYAGFWRRLGASLIDTLLFGILIGALWALGIIDMPKNNMVPAPQMHDESPLGILLQNMLPALVTIFFWVRFLGTPGKLLLGCQVVDARTGARLGTGQAILRYLAYFVSSLPLGLGFFWIAWDKRKQGFHDKIAKTVVILEDPMRTPLPEMDKEWK